MKGTGDAMPRTKIATATKAKYTDRTGRANPRVRPKDEETGEPVLSEDSEPTPAQTPGTTGKASKEEKALYIQKAEQTVRWNQLKIEKAEKELQLKLGTLVELAVIKRQVLAANYTVKNQLLALPDRLAGELAVMTDPHAIRNRLRTSIIETLNELAYEHGARPRT